MALLSAGLAKLHPSFDPSRAAGGAELLAAQDKARAAKLKVWENDVPPPAEEEGEGEAAAGPAVVNGGGSGPREELHIVVADVADANTFFVQIASDDRAEWIAAQLAGMGLDEAPAPSAPLRAGDTCLARFAVDGQWYRAKVEKAHVADPVSSLKGYFRAALPWGCTECVWQSPCLRPSPLCTTHLTCSLGPLPVI